MLPVLEYNDNKKNKENFTSKLGKHERYSIKVLLYM